MSDRCAWTKDGRHDPRVTETVGPDGPVTIKLCRKCGRRKVEPLRKQGMLF